MIIETIINSLQTLYGSTISTNTPPNDCQAKSEHTSIIIQNGDALSCSLQIVMLVERI